MYPLRLAGLEIPESAAVESSEIHPAIAHVLGSPTGCAFKYDTWFNVVAATRLATRMFGFQPHRKTVSNLIYRIFAEPAQRRLWVEWETEARSLVGMFRQSLARWPEAREGRALLEALMHLPDFTAVWNAYDVRLRPSPEEYFRAEPWELNHWKAGTLRIHRIALAIPTRSGGTLVLCSPADPQSAERFEDLAMTHANRRASLGLRCAAS